MLKFQDHENTYAVGELCFAGKFTITSERIITLCKNGKTDTSAVLITTRTDIV